MRAFAIRTFEPGDAQMLYQLCRAAIGKTGGKAYSPLQTEAWLARHPGPELYPQRIAAGAHIFIAYRTLAPTSDPDQTPLAYALLERSGHLDRLYGDPAMGGQGLADMLLQAAEDHARQQGLTRLYTEASELARSAFARAGYTLLERRDFALTHKGGKVAIHNYAMEKWLV